MKIASAPTFFTNAERAATQAASTPTCSEDERNSGVSQRTMTSTAPDRAIAALRISAPGDQRHDGVRIAGEGMIGRHDAAEDGSKQRQQGDEVVAQPVPQEQDDHAAQDGEGYDLVATHCGWSVGDDVSAASRVITPTRRSSEPSTGICSMRCSVMRCATAAAVSCSPQVNREEDITCGHRRRARIAPGSNHPNENVSSRQHPAHAVTGAHEDEPAVDIGHCPRSALHALLRRDKRRVPNHQLGNVHASIPSIGCRALTPGRDGGSLR